MGSMGRNIHRNIGIDFNDVTEKSASDSERTKLEQGSRIGKWVTQIYQAWRQAHCVSSDAYDNFNMAIGEISEDLKSIKLLPCYKTNSKLDASNYRQTSILNTIMKLFERIVYQQLDKNLQAPEMLYEHQSGFGGPRPSRLKVCPQQTLNKYSWAWFSLRYSR